MAEKTSIQRHTKWRRGVSHHRRTEVWKWPAVKAGNHSARRTLFGCKVFENFAYVIHVITRFGLASMLHLWPLSKILSGALILVGVVAVFVATQSPGASTYEILTKVIRFSGVLSTLTIIALGAAWRWVPHFQNSIFPYLGGRWIGQVYFPGECGEETRDVTLDVIQTAFSIKLILKSDESVSQTLAVQSSKSDTDEYKLYYVYENKRKEGRSKGSRVYRGVAILRFELDQGELHGDYFTETHRSGRLILGDRKRNNWWVFWR
ncbi:hypothetical protein [Rhizobium leguminosarum]|uniref:Cap15 family cyclic dinucleotide receptor domain-containing protein n=1 Tax=Rhizobium leguminosarum TaxID=384 RepID=UPI00102FF6EB|nr:hypothetical protein [Rhizobium leguminosarum]TAY14764.1 hypothetical protein ELH96_24790 [Rhizobium leguminosarum]